MVMVSPRAMAVAAVRIERLLRRPVRFEIPIDRITIQRPRDRLAVTHHRIQMRRCDMVMIVVGPPAVASILVQLADGLGKLPGIVTRIEDRDAVDRDSHRAAHEIIAQRDG